MPSKKEVLDVWAHDWRKCVKSLIDRILKTGYCWKGIYLCRSEQDAKDQCGCGGFMKPELKSKIKHLRITIEEISEKKRR